MHPKGTGEPPDHPSPGPEPGAAVHPRLTTDWIRYSPGAGPGISEATIGWVVAVKHRLLAEGGWQLLDLQVYETLYRLVDLEVDEQAGAVLQWTGTYEDLASAIGGGSTRASKDGSRRFAAKALQRARERLEGRGLVTTTEVRDAVQVPGRGYAVRGQGHRWRIVAGGEARYDEVLARHGAAAADQIVPATSSGRAGPAPAASSPRATPQAPSRPDDRPHPSPGTPSRQATPAPAASSGRPSRLQQHAPAAPSGRGGDDLRVRVPDALAGPAVPERATTPLSPPPQQEVAGRDGTAGERVAHLLATDEQVAAAQRRAVDALVEAGWEPDSPRGYVRELGWRCLAVPGLAAHYRSSLDPARPGVLVRFVRAALPGGSSDRDTWPDHALADLILGEGEHAPPVQLTTAEQSAHASLLAWATTGVDQHGDGVVAAYAAAIDQLAAARGVDRHTVVNDLPTLAALLRDPAPAAPAAPGRAVDPDDAPVELSGDAERGPAVDPSPAVNPDGPHAHATVPTTSLPPTDPGPAVEAPPPADAPLTPAWLRAAELLVCDPTRPAALRDAWDAVDDPARRRMLVNLALDHLEHGELDERQLAQATSGFPAMVRALVRADTRWHDAG